MPDASDAGNQQRTLDTYERTAADYVETVGGAPSASAEALRQLAGALQADARVLDVGSGPGWDADALEALGLAVRRTDAADAFCAFQQGRGKHCERLDLLSDPIPGRYDGVLLLCVLQHFSRPQLDVALAKLADALKPRGAVLLMYPEGEADTWEEGAAGPYRVVRWTPAALDARLAQAGFAVVWETRRQGRGGSWRTVLARRR